MLQQTDFNKWRGARNEKEQKEDRHNARKKWKRRVKVVKKKKEGYDMEIGEKMAKRETEIKAKAEKKTEWIKKKERDENKT